MILVMHSEGIILNNIFIMVIYCRAHCKAFSFTYLKEKGLQSVYGMSRLVGYCAREESVDKRLQNHVAIAVIAQ